MIRAVWDRFGAERRRAARSFSCSLSAHLSVLMVLSLCTISFPNRQPIELILTLGSAELPAEPEAAITMTADPPIEEEEPLEEEQSPEEEPPVIEEVAEPEPSPTPPAAPEPLPNTPEPTTQPVSATPALPSELSTDSARIAETNRRVQAAGGKMNVPVRVSLAFFSNDDIDLHVKFRGTHRQTGYRGRADGYIWHRYPQSLWGNLDVDCNRRGGLAMQDPCENIAFPYPPHQARYQVELEHFYSRETPDVTPYVVVVTYGHKTELFTGHIQPGERLSICEFTYRHRNNYQAAQGYGPNTTPIYK